MSKKPLLVIFLVVFIDLLGFGIIWPLLPFIAESFQADPFQIGLLVSAFSFFQFIGAPLLGRLSDRYGRKKLLILSQAGTMAGFILLGLAKSLPLIFLSRMIDGITGGNISIAQAYIADVTSQKERARGMGLLGAAFGLGFILGPAIGGVLSKISYSTPAYFAAGISFITILTTALLLKETVDTKKAQRSGKTRLSWRELKTVLRTQPIGLLIVAFLLINFAFSAMTGTFALWTERSFQYGPSEIGWLFAFVGLIAILTQLVLLPRLVSRLGERTLLKLGVLVLGAGLFWMIFVRTPFFVYPALMFIAFGNSLSNPTIQALASESVAREEYGGTLGIVQSAGSLGRIIGPVTSGELFLRYGKNSPFAFSALVMWGVFFILTRWLRVRADV